MSACVISGNEFRRLKPSSSKCSFPNFCSRFENPCSPKTMSPRMSCTIRAKPGACASTIRFAGFSQKLLVCDCAAARPLRIKSRIHNSSSEIPAATLVSRLAARFACAFGSASSSVFLADFSDCCSARFERESNQSLIHAGGAEILN